MRKQGCDFLVLDISNLLYRTFFAQKNEDAETIMGMACHTALTTVNKYYKMYRPTKVVMTFDRSSWRKKYTEENPCLKPYKGNRRQDMTASQQAKYERFKAHLSEFEELIMYYTSIIALAGDLLEADDLIAAFTQLNPTKNIVIVSADSDLAQLMKHSNVTLISPATDKPHDLSKYDNDPQYYLFQKCIRGDATDNIQSAYPRVRSTRIKDMYKNLTNGDGYEYTNFLQETWLDHNKEAHIVKDTLKHNQILIDLEKQPDHIKELLNKAIEEELTNPKQFSYFYLLKFLGKYNLVKIKQSVENYIPMLSS
ncbi:MAG: hypothetical protein ACXW2E_00830 [Nitrososphaeraceae archaeon]